MTIELRPNGNACILGIDYSYQPALWLRVCLSCSGPNDKRYSKIEGSKKWRDRICKSCLKAAHAEITQIKRDGINISLNEQISNRILAEKLTKL